MARCDPLFAGLPFRPHDHTPIALQPAEQDVGGEIVVCVEFGEEFLINHEIPHPRLAGFLETLDLEDHFLVVHQRSRTQCLASLA